MEICKVEQLRFNNSFVLWFLVESWRNSKNRTGSHISGRSRYSLF